MQNCGAPPNALGGGKLLRVLDANNVDFSQKTINIIALRNDIVVEERVFEYFPFFFLQNGFWMV